MLSCLKRSAICSVKLELSEYGITVKEHCDDMILCYCGALDLGANQAAGNVYVLKISSTHNAQVTYIKVYSTSDNVEDNPGEGDDPIEENNAVFNAVTSVEQLKAGRVIIAADNLAATGLGDKSYGYLNTITVTVNAEGNVETAANNAFELEAVEGGYAIKDNYGKYVYMRRTYPTDMKELMKVYEESLEKLRQRHARLLSEIHVYDKRVALLEEEMDELCEAMSMMRRHVEGYEGYCHQRHELAGPVRRRRQQVHQPRHGRNLPQPDRRHAGQGLGAG